MSAIFYRTNAQSRVFEEVFIRVGLPYKVVGGVRFYERREIRDVLAYLRMLVNPDDTVSLRRILNVPKRGIGDRAEACVEVLAQRTGASFWEALQQAEDAPEIATRSLNNIEAFVAMIQALQAMVDDGARPDDIVDAVLTKSGYLKELEESDRPARRDPRREPRRAGRGGARVRRRARGRDPRLTSSSASRWSPTPTRSPTRTRPAASSR